MTNGPPPLCGEEACRKIRGHAGPHSRWPSEVWAFLQDKDEKKIAKAGFATPRGGAKNAYQNHVVRSNKVIIPYERFADVDLGLYRDGYVVRFFPEQYFEAAGTPKAEFRDPSARLKVGDNAFVLYRTQDSLERLPPLREWQVRRLQQNGRDVVERGRSVSDSGHYVVRVSNPKRHDGPPQGIFATEYADEETNYLCKCVLVWLTLQTVGSPYTTAQAQHLRAVLTAEGLIDAGLYEERGVIRHALTCCPLCLRFIRYEELHQTVSFEDAAGLENAAEQVEGATRSTIVNLFHLKPLVYSSLRHVPANVAWGHAVCNTRLGQRACMSLNELIGLDLKVGIIRPEGIETFGWISADYEMIRSAQGSVWIRLNGDIADAPPHIEEKVDPLDKAASGDEAEAGG